MYNMRESVYASQTETLDKGTLQVRVVCDIGARPIENAQIQIFSMDDPNRVIETLESNKSGISGEIELPAPPLEYSMMPSNNQPYTEYILKVSAPGLKNVDIYGIQLFPGIKALQKVTMYTIGQVNHGNKGIIIGPHSLFGDYPLKVKEADIKENVGTEPVVIPEYITVHDGEPTNISAENHLIRYQDYIKNVVANAIYPTWPIETINANIFSILSFTLNRVYTKWYESQNYDFTITSSTAYDQLWIPGRNTYRNIDITIDYLFHYYLSRPGVLQPILTQSCNCVQTAYDNMLSKWGSKFLGDQNDKTLEILHYYYGNDLYLNMSNKIDGTILPWPGIDLSIDSYGETVRQIQVFLNTLSKVYEEIPVVESDGTFGESTASAVLEFQTIFELPTTGVVDFATWHKITQQYKRLFQLASIC